jgi:hypothetical protein
VINVTLLALIKRTIVQPRLRLDQKITPFVNKYYVSRAIGDEKGPLVAFAQQKRAKLREEILFYDSEAKTNLLFSFQAEKVFDIHGRYFVKDPDGTVIGMFAKDFAKSLLSSTWKVMDGNENIKLVVTESNATLAVLRRFAGAIPIVGEFVDLALAFLKYHFVFLDAESKQPVGKFQKLTIFRDTYKFLLDDEHYAALDWRVYAAMCVALDALQSR